MFPTASCLSKASRVALTPKRGNKDYYKGTRQAFLPGSRRTGAPGKHVIRGTAKYRLLDEKVRVYVAPMIEEIEDSDLKPYVALGAKLTEDHRNAVFSKIRGAGGITPERFLRIAREHTWAKQHPEKPFQDPFRVPLWLKSRINLNLMEEPKIDGIPLLEYRADMLAKRTKAPEGPQLPELEIVNDVQRDNKGKDKRGKDKKPVRQVHAVEGPNASA